MNAILKAAGLLGLALSFGSSASAQFNPVPQLQQTCDLQIAVSNMVNNMLDGSSQFYSATRADAYLCHLITGPGPVLVGVGDTQGEAIAATINECKIRFAFEATPADCSTIANALNSSPGTYCRHMTLIP